MVPLILSELPMLGGFDKNFTKPESHSTTIPAGVKTEKAYIAANLMEAKPEASAEPLPTHTARSEQSPKFVFRVDAIRSLLAVRASH
jgi:hypothetical protein